MWNPGPNTKVFLPSPDSLITNAKWLAGTSKITLIQQQGIKQVTRLAKGVELPPYI